MCESLLRVGEIVLVEGRRIEVQSVPDSTFDWSGVLAYNFAVNSSRWMVAGLSKDDLFRLIGANKYKMQVVGDELVVYSTGRENIIRAKLVQRPVITSADRFGLRDFKFGVVDSSSTLMYIAGLDFFDGPTDDKDDKKEEDKKE